MQEIKATSARIDGYEKVTGRAKYTEDLDLPFGVAYCAVLGSPFSHARIESIDASRAKRLPGVVAVLTGDELEGMDPLLPTGGRGGGLPANHPFIATEKVRYDGEPVAAVAAESAAIAEQALRLIDVEYEQLPAVFDVREALATEAPLLHEALGSNVVGEYTWSWGDVEQGFRESDRIFEDSYSFPSVFHAPIENIGGCLAEFRDGEVHLLAPIQHMFHARQEIAHLFGLQPERVHVRSPYIGGGFGAKELKPAHLIAIWLARRTGRAVQAAASAEESMRTDCRHQMVYKVRTGVKADGTLWAQEIELLSNEGAYARGVQVTRRAISGAWGPYRIRHVRMLGRSVFTNRVPSGAFRSLGKAQVTWGYECNLDSISRQMGIDPMDFRLKNFLHRGDLIASGATPMDTDYDVLLRRAAEAIGWDGRTSRVAPAERTSSSISPLPELGEGPGVRPRRGRGLSTTFRHGYSGGDNSFATVTLDPFGKLRIEHGGVEIGMGIYTVLARVASRALGIPVESIEVTHPTTDGPFTDGVASSRDTVCLGIAVEAACEDLKRELLSTAVQAKGGEPGDWRVRQGRAWRGEESYSLGEIVASVSPAGTMMGKGVHRTPHRDNPFEGQVPHWETSAGAAEVEVDLETGVVRLLKYATVCDVGKAIEPAACRAQLEGGAIMGLGNTFYEEMVYGDEQLLNGDPFQYRLPLLGDVPPELHSVMVENEDGPGPQGAKGMGQTAVSPIAPAVGNAIYEAIGVRIRDLPITPEKILRVLGRLGAPSRPPPSPLPFEGRGRGLGQ